MSSGFKLFLISFFFGWFGADRFYVGKKSSGFLKLLTLGGCGAWWLVDLFLIARGKFMDASGKKIFALIATVYIMFVIISVVFDRATTTPEERNARIAKIVERETKERAEQTKQTEQKIEKKSKEQEYKELYGKTIYDAEPLYKLFRDQPLAMKKAMNGTNTPMQVQGVILEMGSNSYGNYIDLYTNNVNDEKVGNIRIFLADSEWNNDAIMKIKRRDFISVGGLCYGQTEAFGIKSKIIIGNATILKVNKKFL